MKSGIYLIVEFDWPEDISKEMTSNARKLHDLTQDSDWIRETVAASGGIGGDYSSIWIFRLENYAALDRLLKDKVDEIAKTYKEFFSQVDDMSEFIKEEVLFI